MRHSAINGPFIFDDEIVYFNLARSIADAQSFPSKTYNPLYPWLISLFMYKDHTVLTYELIRLFNAILFATVLFPIYFVSRRFLTVRISIFVTLCAVVMPWSAMTALVWAEPLFYALYIYSIYFFFRFLEKSSFVTGSILGIFLGFLFLAKQAGIILIIAITITIVITSLSERSRRPIVSSILPLMIGLALTAVPWIIRNSITEGMGPLGYATHVDRFLSLEVFSIAFLNAIFYQLSYLLASTYFIFLPLLISSLRNIKSMTVSTRTFTLLMLFSTLGIVFITALHRATGGDVIHLPFGRYLAPLLPLYLIYGLHAVDRSLYHKHWVRLVGALLLGVVFLAFYSPLESVTAYSIVNSADTAYLNTLIFQGRLTYEISRNYESVHAVAFALGLAMFAFLFILLFRKRTGVALLMMGALVVFSGTQANKYVNIIATNTDSLNALYRYIQTEELEWENVIFDITNSSEQVNRISRFWIGHTPVNVMGSLFDVINPIIFDFGAYSSPSESTAIRITRPSHPSAIYDKRKKYGFNYVPGTYTNELSLVGTGDEPANYIFGTGERIFQVDAPNGEYTLEFTINLMEAAHREANFVIFVNEQKGLAVQARSNELTRISKSWVNHEGVLRIKVVPVKEMIWAISSVKIQLDVDQRVDRGDGIYLVTTQLLPLKVKRGFGQYKVYIVGE